VSAEAPKTTKRRLAAILSADAVGYSRLMSENEEATIDALEASREIFRERVAGHEGRVVDTAGDSVLAVFDSVVEALRAAIDIQKELGERNERLPPGRRMNFRIGVNVGDLVEQTDGTVYGDGVNIAARLQALAEPGAICASEVAYTQARNKLDARFEPLGEHKVKNIAEPVRAYRALPGAATAAAVESKPAAVKASIAVLPFENMSADAEQEYFSDGITEDLITALSRIRWLLVIARNSTFTYKGKAVDVKQVGRELGVRYVLEGSVRRGGSRVRITAQLIDAEGGGHVWAERYDRELADVFAVQDEITETIAASIEPELAHAERERARRKPPQSLDAWDLYHRGLWHLARFNAADNAEAIALFERAIASDPTCAAFHTELARAHFSNHALFGESGRSLERAFDASRVAIGLDNKDAMAHCMLGRAYGAHGEHASAIAESEAALRLNPNLAYAHFALGIERVFTGRPADALPEADWAERLSPHDPYLWLFDTVRAWAWISLGDFEQAREASTRSVRQPAAGFPAWATLGSALAHGGLMEEARSALAKTKALRPDFSPALFDSTWPNTDAAFFERFFDGLRRIDPPLPDPRSITRRTVSGVAKQANKKE
jgi:adenylate cyclase